MYHEPLRARLNFKGDRDRVAHTKYGRHARTITPHFHLNRVLTSCHEDSEPSNVPEAAKQDGTQMIVLKPILDQVYPRGTRPKGAICVQRFDDSLSPAIRITYRISLRSSSIGEPRYPLLRVVKSVINVRAWFNTSEKSPLTHAVLAVQPDLCCPKTLS